MLARLLLLSTALVPAFSQAHDHGAHVHGAAEIEVVIDGNTIAVALESPADNLLGFEHAPKTDAQKKKLAAVTAQLQQPNSVLTVPAGCTAATPSVDMPAFKGGDHADIRAEYQLSCTSRPESLTLALWKNFPRIERVKAAIAASDGQRALKLKRGQPLRLAR
ncbi:ZrgA family zinc uptake protein [Chitinibacteraceae bacterium HSL-7]